MDRNLSVLLSVSAAIVAVLAAVCVWDECDRSQAVLVDTGGCYCWNLPSDGLPDYRWFVDGSPGLGMEELGAAAPDGLQNGEFVSFLLTSWSEGKFHLRAELRNVQDPEDVKSAEELDIEFAGPLSLPTGVASHRAEVEIGDAFELKLRSNPTTGFSWVLEGVPDWVDVCRSYVQDSCPPGATGVGGTETFAFSSIEAGECHLTLRYERPWETVPPVEALDIDLVFFCATGRCSPRIRIMFLSRPGRPIV